jgi:hypothetical protein
MAVLRSLVEEREGELTSERATGSGVEGVTAVALVVVLAMAAMAALYLET